jgi:hypothetical protein
VHLAFRTLKSHTLLLPAIPTTLSIYALEAPQTQTNAQEALETDRRFQVVTKTRIIEI